jgi:hypothetical protein
MRRLPSILIAAAAAIAVASAPLTAQGLTAGEGPLRGSDALTIGPVASVNLPVGEFGNVASTGFSIGAQGTYGLGVVTLLGEVTYDVFGGYTYEGIPYDDFTGFAYDVGARVSLPISAGLYAGGVAGFWTGDLDEFDVVPLVGIHLGPVDMNGRYKGLFGDADWFAISGAVHSRLK